METFREIQSIAVALANIPQWTKDVSSPVLDRLEALLDGTKSAEHGRILGQCREQLAYPLLYAWSLPSQGDLNGKPYRITNRHREMLLVSLDGLLRLGASVSLDLSRQTYQLLLQWLAASDGAAWSSCHEELKFAVIRVFRGLMVPDRHPLFHRKDLGSGEERYRLSMAHWIFMLLDLVADEQHASPELREEAIRGLHDALVALGDADIMVNFLPGVSTAIIKCMVLDARKSPKFIVACLDCLKNLVCTVFEAPILGDELSNRRSSASVSTRIPHILRTSQWLEQTRPQMQKVIQHISAFHQHPDPRVRLALVDFASEMFQRCRQNLGVEVSLRLINLLVLHCVDDQKQVRETAQQTLPNDWDDEKLLYAVQKEFRCLLTEFSSWMLSIDDQKRLDHVQLIVGYSDLLGERSGVVLDSVRTPLLEAILDVLSPNLNCVSLVAQRSVDSHALIPQAETTGEVKMEYANFQSKNLEESLRMLARRLASLNPHQIAEELLSQAPPRRAAAFLLTGEIIPIFDSADPILVTILEELLEDRILRQPTHSTEDCSIPPIGIHEYSRAIHEIRFALDSVARIAEKKRRDFAWHLMRCLVPILEMLGHPNRTISESAWKCLDRIAHAVSDHGDVQALLAENVDYIVDALTTRMRHLQLYPGTPRILLALLSVVRENGVELYADAVYQMIRWVGEHPNQNALVKDIMRSLQQLVEILCGLIAPASDAAARNTVGDTDEVTTEMMACGIGSVQIPADVWRNASPEMRQFAIDFLKERAQTTEESEPRSMASIEQVERYFEEQRKSKEEEFMRGLKGDPTDQEDSEAGSRKRHLLQLFQSALDLASHFLSHEDPELRLCVLRMVKAGLPVLGRKKSDILAFLDTHWESLVYRLVDMEVFTVLETIDLFTHAMDLCGDFLARKFQERLLPEYQKLLVQHFNGNRAETRKPEYRFSVSYRMQKAVLGSISVAVTSDCFASRDVLPFVALGMRLQGMDQSPLLQQCAQNLLDNLTRKHGDFVASYLLMDEKDSRSHLGWDANFGKLISQSPAERTVLKERLRKQLSLVNE